MLTTARLDETNIRLNILRHWDQTKHKYQAQCIMKITVRSDLSENLQMPNSTTRQPSGGYWLIKIKTLADPQMELVIFITHLVSLYSLYLFNVKYLSK